MELVRNDDRGGGANRHIVTHQKVELVRNLGSRHATARFDLPTGIAIAVTPLSVSYAIFSFVTPIAKLIGFMESEFIREPHRKPVKKVYIAVQVR